ncbi:MAG: S41 family peptidase [Thermogutta sp.]
MEQGRDSQYRGIRILAGCRDRRYVKWMRSIVASLIIFVPLFWWEFSGSITCKGYAEDAENAGPPAISPFDQLKTILEDGLKLEHQSRWGEALSLYEDALRQFPGEKVLEQRFHEARIHYDLLRRHGDETYLNLVKSLSATDAFQIYDEVLLKIQAHYVESPGWEYLYEQGIHAVAIALTEPKFLAAQQLSISAEAAAATARDLPLVVPPQSVQTRQTAINAATLVSNWLKERIGLAPQSAIMEMVCGMVNALDPYSAYLTPGQLSELYSQIEGNFVGLGIELRPQVDALVVLRVIPGSPAEKSAISPGDRIVAIDGQSVTELSPNRAADQLKGPEGSQVSLTILGKDDRPRQITVRRTRVEVPSVADVKMIDQELKIGYFRLLSFQRTTATDVATALRDLSQQGLASLIIDLRGNPGGLLGAAVETADLFLRQGVVVSTRGRNPQENLVYNAHDAGTWTIPLVVLIDRESASAAEIFAGAIQDQGRGTIVGTSSYGKGSIQGIFPLNRGDSGLRLTTARFFSPQGRPYAGRGVIPDIRVQVVARPGEFSNSSAEKTTPLSSTALTESGQKNSQENDPILEAGLQAAKRIVAQRPAATW